MATQKTTPAVSFDANASLGLLPEVERAIQKGTDYGLNASSIHTGGQRARAIIEDARERIRSLTGLTGTAHRVVFTSGATESNNIALHYPFLPAESGHESARCDYRGSVVVGASEHPAVLGAAARLAAHGVSVIEVTPDTTGAITPEAVLSAVADDTRLVSVMVANNETGIVNPVAAISRALKGRRPDVLLHTDAVQAAGKIHVHFDELGADLMSLSGHKIGALNGIGALIARDGLSAKTFICGGSQETGWRAGTENVQGIYSFGIAAECVRSALFADESQMLPGREYIWEALQRAVPGARLIGQKAHRLPNTLLVQIPGVKGDDLVVAADLEGLFISSGAACASGKPNPSHVLLAAGLSESETAEVVRISLSPFCSMEEVREGTERLLRAVSRMRAGTSAAHQGGELQ